MARFEELTVGKLHILNSAKLHTYGGLTLPAGEMLDAMYADDSIKQSKLNRAFTLEEFKAAPVCMNSAGIAPAGAGGSTNIMSLGENLFEYYMMGTQTLLNPTIAALGLLCSLDLTSNDGVEYSQGITARAKHAFTIGTSPAFYFKVRLNVVDVSGSDICAVGFRKSEAYNGTFVNYTDKATLNKILGAINISTALNNGADSNTDTTNTWADNDTHTLEVYVSASGVVTYKIDGAAPTTTAAFTFDTGDIVVPFFHLLHDTTTPGAVYLQAWECGYQ